MHITILIQGRGDEKLPAITVRDLTVVLRALIATRSQAFAEQAGHYVADQIRPFIDELQGLINTSGDKPGWNAKALEETKRALADAFLTLGEQAGLNEPLTEAINLYQSILQSPASRDDPLDWAMTQNNLGAALLRLGERESGTARLEEAVAAYREAQVVWTGAAVPKSWRDKVKEVIESTLTEIAKRNDRKE
jgi:tetratricopeptide (TPR) repeat protein